MSAGSKGDPERPDLGIDQFLGDPTRDLDEWRALWERDTPFPLRSDRGFLGRLLVAAKRLLRPLVKVPQNDLWERQRVFNLLTLEWIGGIQGQLARLDALEARIQALETFPGEDFTR